MIVIDGWQVPGYETAINCGFKLSGDDLSGYGSFSLSSDKGVKPAVVSVQTKIPYVDKKLLAQLVSLAKELDANGARKLRTVNSDVTDAFKVRKVKFDGEIKASEDDQVRAWVVSFKLLEVLSKSEREQQQLDGKAAENTKTQRVDGHNTIQQQFEQAEGP
ncbi:baseplate complex protein [Algicola sagamiensis]|uniref:baseplate complex protein n=1 Tax=Algicola sagamiensis TaxID=163869 RepID=UPI000371E63B|nr:hypothetical protein [Algicola sagamiensis]